MPALLAVGGSLSAMPAAALELGDLTVQSRLGQPLRASIAFALAPNEQLSDYCIAMRPGASMSGLPSVGQASIRISNGVILLTGKTAIREPMVSAHVVVNCPYAPNISREYMAFVDPVSVAAPAQAASTAVAPSLPSSAAATPPVAVATPPVATQRTATQNTRRAAASPIAKDISPSSLYQVQPGESLSEIVQRIENRSVKLWPAVNAIFDGNPDAFIDNDPNKLKAGSWLKIPSLDGSTAAVVSAIAAPSAQPEPVESVSSSTPVDIDSVPAASTTVANTVDNTLVTTGDLKPGDIVVDENPFVEPVATGEVVDIPDTRLEGPITTSTSPNGSVAIITTPTEASESSMGWLAWLAGGGVALVLALLILGRRKRPGPEFAPFASEETQLNRRVTDPGNDTGEVAVAEIDFDLSDDSPTEENLALDADLIMGTGLSEGSQIDVSEVAFAKPVEVDVELPFEPVAAADDTNIIAAVATDELSILDSEVLPGDNDYDMSVIMDATKMPQSADVTEKDLKAVELPDQNDTLVTDNYTIAKEVDYQILEQDYEDEMTATQALNVEIARAASELAERMDEDSDEDYEDTATTAMPLASVTELDATVEMPKATNDEDTDSTVEMPADDETANMQIESGKVG